MPAALGFIRQALVGIGGASPSVLVETALELIRSDGATSSLFRGEFAAFTDPQATDFSILGRDMLNLFDLILSRRRDEALLLIAGHSYSVAVRP